MRNHVRLGSLNPIVVARNVVSGTATFMLVFLFIYALPSSASQTAQRPPPDVGAFAKNDNRYIIDANRSQTADSELWIDNLELKAQWWPLLGQPVEYYTLTWRPSFLGAPVTNHPVHNSYSLNRDALLDYPDLVKRYDSLRPLKLDFRLEFLLFTNDPSCYEGIDPLLKESLYSGFANVTTIIPDSMILIGKSGKPQGSISPGSRRNEWKDFFHKVGSYTTESFSNKDLGLLFKCSDYIKPTNLLIENIDYPQSEINSIYAELERRVAQVKRQRDAEIAKRQQEELERASANRSKQTNQSLSSSAFLDELDNALATLDQMDPEIKQAPSVAVSDSMQSGPTFPETASTVNYQKTPGVETVKYALVNSISNQMFDKDGKQKGPLSHLVYRLYVLP